ncbi:hypothetical protein GCM10017673_44500 [Streptosporangium violaceochromogenes]|nr:hypothetical protein GCM10017673_44500 [Streptosporangium violaceochromogenes]
MGVCRRILAVSAMALIASGVLTAASPAGAAAPGPQHGAGSAAVTRAVVTDIREILNQRSEQVDIFNREGRTSFAVLPNSRWAGSMWVPWATGRVEAKEKCIVVYDGTHLLWVYQDHSDTNNTVKYHVDGTYWSPVAVPGSSTGGGRKRLIIRSDGSLLMENTN